MNSKSKFREAAEQFKFGREFKELHELQEAEFNWDSLESVAVAHGKKRGKMKMPSVHFCKSQSELDSLLDRLKD